MIKYNISQAENHVLKIALGAGSAKGSRDTTPRQNQKYVVGKPKYRRTNMKREDTTELQKDSPVASKLASIANSVETGCKVWIKSDREHHKHTTECDLERALFCCSVSINNYCLSGEPNPKKNT